MQAVLLFERCEPVQLPGGGELVYLRVKLQNRGFVRLRQPLVVGQCNVFVGVLQPEVYTLPEGSIDVIAIEQFGGVLLDGAAIESRLRHALRICDLTRLRVTVVNMSGALDGPIIPGLEVGLLLLLLAQGVVEGRIGVAGKWA